jgi:hypothetical protein
MLLDTLCAANRTLNCTPICTQNRIQGLVTRAILCAISCAICCKSHMRFAASAIWCPTRITFYLLLVQKNAHKFAHQIACATPNCSCDTKSHLRHQIASVRFGVANLSQLELEIAHQIAQQIAQQIATRYHTTNRNTISHAMCKR